MQPQVKSIFYLDKSKFSRADKNSVQLGKYTSGLKIGTVSKPVIQHVAEQPTTERRRHKKHHGEAKETAEQAPAQPAPQETPEVAFEPAPVQQEEAPAPKEEAQAEPEKQEPAAPEPAQPAEKPAPVDDLASLFM